MDQPLVLTILDVHLAICRVEPGGPVPGWATRSSFFSVTRTAQELSIVCPEAEVPAGVRCAPGWRALKLEGPFEFTQVGVLLAVAAPLARAGVSILAIATYETDYILVPEALLEQAIEALARDGLCIRQEGGQAGEFVNTTP